MSIDLVWVRTMENTPIPSTTTYLTRLIEKVESVVKRMRWKAFFFLKGKEDDQADDDVDDQTRTNKTFGFKTRKCLPKVEEMDKFEDDLLKMIERVQFRKVTDDFQNKLLQVIDTIRKSKDVIVRADKMRNLYAVTEDPYEKLLTNNITKNYRSAPAGTYNTINQEAQRIAKELKIDERMECIAKNMECMAKNESDLTSKDHKQKFFNSSTVPTYKPSKKRYWNNL